MYRTKDTGQIRTSLEERIHPGCTGGLKDTIKTIIILAVGILIVRGTYELSKDGIQNAYCKCNQYMNNVLDYANYHANQLYKK